MSVRRYPNPWVFIPALGGGLLGGGIAYALAACERLCLGGLLWGIVIGVATAVGFGTVAVLADRSIGEWRAAAAQSKPHPSPGSELSDDDQ